MNDKIYICHASVDKPIAKKICFELEKNDIPFWIAPRDVPPNCSDYGKTIKQAIDKCRMLIFVYSRNSFTLSHLIEDVSQAIRKKKIVILFQIDEICDYEENEFITTYSNRLNGMVFSFESMMAVFSLESMMARMIYMINNNSDEFGIDLYIPYKNHKINYLKSILIYPYQFIRSIFKIAIKQIVRKYSRKVGPNRKLDWFDEDCDHYDSYERPSKSVSRSISKRGQGNIRFSDKSDYDCYEKELPGFSHFESIMGEDNIRFSAFGPKTVKSNDNFVVEIWAYKSDQYNEIVDKISLARKKIDQGSIGPFKVSNESMFRIQLQTTEFEVNTGIQPLNWLGEPSNANFSLKVPESLKKGYYPVSAIILQNNIPIATLVFEILVNTKTMKSEIVGSHKRVNSIFASYATEDRQKVILWTQGAQMTGTNVFLDVLSLRSGQNWEKELWNQIPNNDIFVLFWSDAASKSAWVEKEWRCALDCKGIDAIYPVPFSDPRDVPPPQELASVKHFNDLSFFIYEYEQNRRS
jgi:hypothetical protein